jgi:hypothetical protein
MKFFRPLLIWLSQGFALINGIITWIFAPIKGIFTLVSKLFLRQRATPSVAE